MKFFVVLPKKTYTPHLEKYLCVFNVIIFLLSNGLSFEKKTLVFITYFTINMNIFHIQEMFSEGRGRVMNFSGGRTRAGDKTFWTGGHGRVSLKFVGWVRAGDEIFLRAGSPVLHP